MASWCWAASAGDAGLLEQLARPAMPIGIILSLDYSWRRLRRAAFPVAGVDLWPRRLIAMTLARVGSGEGPDLVRLDRCLTGERGRSPSSMPRAACVTCRISGAWRRWAWRACSSLGAA